MYSIKPVSPTLQASSNPESEFNKQLRYHCATVAAKKFQASSILISQVPTCKVLLNGIALIALH